MFKLRKIKILATISLLLSIVVTNTYSQEQSISIKCGNFIGESLVVSNGKIDSENDGLSGQIMNFDIPAPANMGSLVKIQWTGGRNTMDVVGVIIMSSPDNWINFIQAHPSVVRNYTFYFPSQGPFIMALVETQTQIMTYKPEVRTFFGSCSLR